MRLVRHLRQADRLDGAAGLDVLGLDHACTVVAYICSKTCSRPEWHLQMDACHCPQTRCSPGVESLTAAIAAWASG